MNASSGKTNPRISVVMPSYNQATFLEEAIRSVVDQDYSDIELIVIDGGSSDQSIDILKKYENRITAWVSEPDEGQSDALNKGFSKITGDLVGWLNSDDTYEPGVFRHVAEVFSDPTIHVVMCKRFGLMDAEGSVHGLKENTFTTHSDLVRFWLTNGMTINQPCVFFRRNLIDVMQPVFDTRLHYAMDYDLWLRFTEHYRIHVVEGHWANYRFHDTSKSGTGFGKFFSEWYAVSERYWGSRYSRGWWGHWFNLAYYRYVRRVPAGLIKRARKLFNG